MSPSSSCSGSPASSANAWTATTCATNNTSNVRRFLLLGFARDLGQSVDDDHLQQQQHDQRSLGLVPGQCTDFPERLDNHYLPDPDGWADRRVVVYAGAWERWQQLDNDELHSQQQRERSSGLVRGLGPDVG